MSQKKERGMFVPEGAGGFLNPPTHPEHTSCVETDLGRRRENRNHMSLSAAAECEWLDAATRAEARRRLAQWVPPPVDSPAVVDWIHQVLGYYNNCYRNGNVAPELQWHAGHVHIRPDADPVLNADNHAGVHLIRTYYPAFTPTADHFANAYWGTKPGT